LLSMNLRIQWIVKFTRRPIMHIEFNATDQDKYLLRENSLEQILDTLLNKQLYWDERREALRELEELKDVASQLWSCASSSALAEKIMSTDNFSAREWLQRHKETNNAL